MREVANRKERNTPYSIPTVFFFSYASPFSLNASGASAGDNVCFRAAVCEWDPVHRWNQGVLPEQYQVVLAGVHINQDLISWVRIEEYMGFGDHRGF